MTHDPKEKFRRLLRQAIKAKARQFGHKEAAEKAGYTYNTLYRKLRGTRHLRFDEVLEISRDLNIELHGLLDAAGYIPESYPYSDWSLLESISDSHSPDSDLVATTNRILSSFAGSIPANGFNISPSSSFYEIESLQTRSKALFRDRALAYRKELIARTEHRRKFDIDCLASLVEVLDLTARAMSAQLPRSASILSLALSIPLDELSMSRLYLEEYACHLLLRADHLPQAKARSTHLFGKISLLEAPHFATRVLMVLSQVLRDQEDLIHEKRVLEKATLLGRGSQLGDFAAFNLANLEARAGNFQRAIQIVGDIEQDAVQSPRFAFSLLWLNGKLRVLSGDSWTGSQILQQALGLRPEDQDPISLFHLFEDLRPLLPASELKSRFRRLMPLFRRVDSPQARKVAFRLYRSLEEDRPHEFPSILASLQKTT